MNNNRFRLFYKDSNIEINRIMDDQGEVLLTYWYYIKDVESGKVKDHVDIRELNSFQKYNGGKKPSSFQMICRTAEVVPEIIKNAVANREIEF